MKLSDFRLNFELMPIIFVVFLICLLALSSFAQTDSQPVIVQPGAPGQPSKKLPPNTKPKLPETSAKDVEFMQGMIMHHGQAVEMTALIEERTQNKEVLKLGAKISQSQTDEMNFMRRWLVLRGEKTSMQGMSNKDPANHQVHSLMPGMLTPKQMENLRKAKGAEFDRLFLRGMIQHHEGALVMVKDLFDTAGAGQDAELFNFASDVDTGQRGEIKIMQEILNRKPKTENK